MSDATDALLISILRRTAWHWAEAARFTWRGFGAFWAVMWARSPGELAAALDDVLAWLKQSDQRAEQMDIEVAGAAKALAQLMKQ